VGSTVVVSIDTGDVLAGTVPARALRLILEWAELHRDELRLNGLAPARTRRCRASIRFPSLGVVNFTAHLHRITGVESVGEHRLRVTFDDGASGEIDASTWTWRGVFEPVRDPDYFARVELDRQLGSISWPNGADVAPETLHLWVTEGRDRLSA
jgi:DUF971 family protein